MLKKVCLLAILALLEVGAETEEFNKCGDNIQCAEEELMKVIEELDRMKKLEVLGDAVVIQRSNSSSQLATGKSMDVFDRVLKYVGDHELKINLPMNLEAARGLVSEARSSKLKKILLPILLLLKLKAAVILPAVISAVALVAFKGLGVSLLALVFSAVAAFKAAVDAHSTKSSTFAVDIAPQVPIPQWSRTGASHQADGWQGYHTIP